LSVPVFRCLARLAPARAEWTVAVGFYPIGNGSITP